MQIEYIIILLLLLLLPGVITIIIIIIIIIIITSDKVVFNSKLWNLVNSDVPSQSSYLLN